MSKSYDDYEGRLAAAIRAALARIRGAWDDPDLVEFGPLMPDTLADVTAILEGVEMMVAAHDDKAQAVIALILKRHPNGVTMQQLIGGLTGPGRTVGQAQQAARDALSDGRIRLGWGARLYEPKAKEYQVRTPKD